MKRRIGIILCLLVLPTLLLCTFALADVEIGEANFPDTAFRKYVKENFDKNSDGFLDESEISAAQYIEINAKRIKSLQGIGLFSALTHLSCSGNELADLDVSRNPELTYLDCSGNWLTELDVSRNPALCLLQFDGNRLTAIDLSKNTSLQYLFCMGNLLEKLDVSRNPALETIQCDSNRLKTLDVSKNPELGVLYCQDNRLTKLTLGKHAKLTDLRCASNRLKTLDITGCSAIAEIAERDKPHTFTPYFEDPLYGWYDIDHYTVFSVDKSLNVESRISIGGLKYILNHTKKTAAVTGAVKKTVAKVTVPATVKAGGRAYKVTSVAGKAFSGLAKLISLEIGANVARIGTKAFYNCAKLKNVKIKTLKLTDKTVGANAFGKNSKKAVYKVPAKKLAAYRKWMTKKGVPNQKQVQ